MSANATASGKLPTELKDRRATRGRRISPEGENGFYETWYPVCLSADVAPGQVLGRPFLDGRVVVFRGANGVARVMSAYCRHFGADLGTGGVVIGDELQCPYHHWRYGQDGACSHIAVSGPVPKQARLYTFPSVEKWGIVFAYYGENETPVFQLPELPIPKGALRTFGTFKFKLDISLQFANSVDYQHLVVLHGLTMERYPEVTFDRYHMTQKNMVFSDSTRANGARFGLDVAIYGTSILIFGGDISGQPIYFAILGTPITSEGVSYGYTVTTVPHGGDDPQSAAATTESLIQWEKWAHRLMVEDDKPIMDTVSFRQDAFLAQDKYVAEYLRYLERYPRVHPAEDFIK
jgi:nitrite reductase/ring-hydroxylating ferredoxin subunit